MGGHCGFNSAWRQGGNKKKIKMPFTRVCETFIFEFLIGKMKSEFG